MPFDINWQPPDAWAGFGNEEEFPPLTSEPYLLATARHLFYDTMASSDMDSSIPISSDEIYVSTRDYQLPPKSYPYGSGQPSSQPISLPVGYHTLGQIIYSVA